MTISLLALWALLACAPAALGPPPVPFAEGQQLQLGASLTGGSLLPPTQEQGCGLALGCTGGSAGFWVGGARGRAELGVVGFAGNTSLFGGGVYGRYWYIDEPSYRIGGELQAGFLWAAASIPAARRISPSVWVWTAPSAGLRYFSLLRLPVGLATQQGEHLALSAEFSVGWDPWWLYQSPSTVFLSSGLSVSWRW